MLNGPFSGTTQVSQYQKGKTNLDFPEARDSGWQWHQLDHMHVCTSLQTDNHTNTPPLSFVVGCRTTSTCFHSTLNNNHCKITLNMQSYTSNYPVKTTQ